MAITVDKTISKIVENGLCTGCGTCAGICPVDAIEMVIEHKKGIYIPQLDEEKCNQCGLCFDVCPGHSVDFRKLNQEIFGKEPNDVLIGNYLNCHIGHATDYDIRYNSSSGGLVTALLIYALEERMIDGALVTRMKKDKPLEPEPFIARTKDEIIEAAKSKYCPVPANIGLKEILKAKEGERFAVVGLPCHIHGIRKAGTTSKWLKEKIVLHLGLFCNHVPSFWGTKLLLQKLEVDDGEIVKLDYRGEGWPGYMKISKRDGEILPLPDYWGFVGSYFFFPSRCLMCDDATNEVADISFGDAWLPELSDDKTGKSLIISRNEISEEVLHKMKSKNNVELTKVSANEVIRSHRGLLYLKKGVKARQGLFKTMPYNVRSGSLKPDIIDRLLALFPYLNSCVGSKAIFRRILSHIPSKLIRLYGIPYAVISSRKAHHRLLNQFSV
jgi:coenzyme F420 hydrogenase subunit beta